MLATTYSRSGGFVILRKRSAAAPDPLRLDAACQNAIAAMRGAVAGHHSTSPIALDLCTAAADLEAALKGE